MVTLEIDISRIKGNIAAIKNKTIARVYAVVKANAYGHGIEICKYIHNDVYGFAVSCESEAQELLNLGITNPVLILCPCLRPINNATNIVYTICNHKDLDLLQNCNVAVKINTGMNRLGLTANGFKGVINKLESRKDLKLCEIFTHFYSCEGAGEQFKEFSSINSGFNDFKEKGVLRHCCASNCLNLPPVMHLDAVRCGLAIYGYSDFTKPIMKAYTQIEQVNDVKKGQHIGYGDFVAGKDTRVAVLRAGYADGFKRTAGQNVKINGSICKIVGNVCMDMCMADVTGLNVKSGDLAYLLEGDLNAESLAKEQNTIPYEILTSFSSGRIKRVYKE